jgi:hypothetical protein
MAASRSRIWDRERKHSASAPSRRRVRAVVPPESRGYRCLAGVYPQQVKSRQSRSTNWSLVEPTFTPSRRVIYPGSGLACPKKRGITKVNPTRTTDAIHGSYQLYCAYGPPSANTQIAKERVETTS